jgi:DNA-binding beta-propeller fold protein YncE
VGVAVVAALGGCAAPKKGDGPEFQTQWPGPPDEARYFFERSLASSADVVRETTAQRFKRLATGETLSGKGLEKPYGVAAYDGYVFVSDTQSRKVAVFDVAGSRYYEIGTEGSGSLAKPLGIAVDSKRRLYVCDSTAKRIAVYEFDGKYLGAIDGRELFKRPTGVAVNADGSRIYVVDTGGVETSEHRVLVFDGQWRHIFDIGSRGDDPGKFNLPLNATVGLDGTVYVVDGGNFRIQAFTPDGAFKFAFGVVGKRPGQFAKPTTVAVDKDNNIYVSDSAFGNFQIFNAKGELLMWIGTRSSENKPGGYMLPKGLAVDPTDGRVYFADQYFRRVDVFRPAKTPVERQPRGPVAPVG